ncbi:MAG: CDP-glycerol glycerophosphotransferase family protein [Microbacterium sp.]
MTGIDELADEPVSRRRPWVFAWALRVLQRGQSIETIFAFVAVVVIATLWPWPLAVLISAVLLYGVGLALVAQDSGAYWVGRYFAQRLVLVAGSIVYLSVNDELAGAVGAVLTAAAVMSGALLRPAISNLNAVSAVGLPGLATFSNLSLVSRLTHVVVGAAVVVLVGAASFQSTWLAFLAGCVAAAASAGLTVATLVMTRRRARSKRQALTALAALKPRFYLHWDAPSEGFYQVTMWLPYLKRIGLPFAVIVRTPRQLQFLAPHVDVPVVYCGAMADIDRTVVPSLSTVFYVNTALRNAHYLRFNALRHIQLNHGDSDKPASASRQFRAFDQNFVAGQAAVDRFALYGIDMPQSLIRVVGRPQVENIHRADPGAPVRTVLYAPTWGGFFADSDFSSLRVGVDLVRELLSRGCRVIFRPHAFTDRSAKLAKAADAIRHLLSEDAAASGRDHLFGPAAETERSIVDCFNESDAMIADVSSIVTDYLFSEKPLVMMAVRYTVDDFVRAYPVARAAYVIESARPAFAEVLDAALGSDPMREQRRRSRDYYLGDFAAEGYAEAFVEAARAEVERPR